MKNTFKTSKEFTNAGHVFDEDGQRAVIRELVAIVLDNTWMMQHFQHAQLGLQCLNLLAIVNNHSLFHFISYLSPNYSNSG